MHNHFYKCKGSKLPSPVAEELAAGLATCQELQPVTSMGSKHTSKPDIFFQESEGPRSASADFIRARACIGIPATRCPQSGSFGQLTLQGMSGYIVGYM